MIVFIFGFSILIHEFVHIIIGMFFGYKLKSFSFVPFGTAIEFKENNKSSFIKNIIVWISGPFSNFCICYFVYFGNIKFKEEIFYTNLILGIFNLLPLNPLDGGKIVRDILKLFFNNRIANIFSYKINKFFLCLFTFLYSIFIVKIKNISLIFILGYLWYLDFKENKRISTLKKVYSVIEKNYF